MYRQIPAEIKARSHNFRATLLDANRDARFFESRFPNVPARFGGSVIMKSYSPYQFAIARILAGGLTLWLAVASLMSAGQPARSDASLYLIGGAVGVLIGVLLVFGIFRRSAALAGAGLLFAREFAIEPTAMRAALVFLAPLFGMFLVLALTPTGETLRAPICARAGAGACPAAWRFPKWLAVFALLIFAVTGCALVLSGEPIGVIEWSALALVGLIGINFAWIFPVRRIDEGSQNPIVFFDGVCGLCNSAVDFILAQDYAGVFRYAPIQGDTAARLLPPEQIVDMDSMVYRDRAGAMCTRSDAILRVGLELGGIWKPFALMGLVIPRPIRNAAYNLVAKNRYRWFGKKESCRMPTPEERKLFLM